MESNSGNHGMHCIKNVICHLVTLGNLNHKLIDWSSSGLAHRLPPGPVKMRLQTNKYLDARGLNGEPRSIRGWICLYLFTSRRRLQILGVFRLLRRAVGIAQKLPADAPEVVRDAAPNQVLQIETPLQN